jgi:phage repressor protein C with HTH and peptisase S24 domain
MLFSERFENALSRACKKQIDLNRDLEIASGVTSGWKKRESIGKKYLKEVADYLDVDTDYLLGNQDEFRRYNSDIIPVKQLDEENYVTLPTIYAGAGAEAFAVEKAENRVFPRDLIPPQIALDENVLVTVITGNSMEPLYYENDIVFIDMVNGREFVPSDGTYLVRYGDVVQIKDVEFVGNGEILLRSRNNTDVKNPTKDGLEWEIVGKPYANLHPSVGSKLRVK